MFTFDENVDLVDNYSITFDGVTFDGTLGNVATVSGNTLTLSSENKELNTDSSAGKNHDVASNVENSAGVDATYTDLLLVDDEDATNDSTDQSFLVDNAKASFIDATIASNTVNFHF